MTNVFVDAFEKVIVKMRGTFDPTFDATFGQGAPYFMYGHILEISNRLLKKDVAGPNAKHKKYPLIALVMDTEEDFVDEMYKYKAHVLLLMKTEGKYETPERYQKVIKPILYPIYFKLLDGLRKSGDFTWSGGKYPAHKKYDRPLYGTVAANKNVKTIFNDPIDCIELMDLIINSPFKNC